MPIKTLFVDLDDTLYPSHSGVWEAIAERINLFMLERVGIPEEIITTERRRLYSTYGTTLRGLMAEYGSDMEEFLAFVHDVPLRNFIAPDPAVRSALSAMPQRRIIFTNADVPHAHRVLNVLELDGLFEQIIDIHTISPFCKPMQPAFELALAQAGNPNPSECAFFDDNIPNLSTARKLGFYTVRVGKTDPLPDYHAGLESMRDLTPGLLEYLNG